MGLGGYIRVRMSETISFVASDELAEFLDREAEKRMTTVSSTAQMLLAEKAREMGDLDEDRAEGDEGGSNGAEASKDPLEQLPFSTHPEAWYEPNASDPDKILAVRIPEEERGAEDRRYYKTVAGAAEAIRRWYE